MKAALRCKEHYQGDRCRLESGHGDNLLHRGIFSSWTTDQETVLHRIGIRFKRNRVKAREDRQSKRFIKDLTKRIKLSILALEYSKSFLKKPEEKDVVYSGDVDKPGVP